MMALARVDRQGDRLVVVNLNSARRGALSPELYDAILGAVQAARDPKVGAIILTSEGGYFCAGGDLNLIRERQGLSEAERRVRIEHLHDCVRAIRSSEVPVIAAVEGGAAGAGLSIALACDLIVAATGAKFVAAYVKAGLVPDGGLTSALARTVPRQLAMEMCLLGKPVVAERMAELGVVNSVVPPGTVDATAHKLADALAQGPRKAQHVIRSAVAQAYETREAEQLTHERNSMASAIGTDEAEEGIDAFLAKRPPDFRRLRG